MTMQEVRQRATRVTLMQEHAQMLVDVVRSAATAPPYFLASFLEIGCHRRIPLRGSTSLFAAFPMKSHVKSLCNSNINRVNSSFTRVSESLEASPPLR